MTHLWKSAQTYTFDMPRPRVQDVYVKSMYNPLRPYIISKNPKVTNVKFDSYYPLVHIEIEQPKYCDEPYFSEEDVGNLLQTYMDYANMSREEIRDWYQKHSHPLFEL